MSKITDDKKTPEMIEQLKNYWAAQEVSGSTFAPSINPPISEPEQPCFGRYTPDLFFVDENDPVGRPDGFYYIAQGQQVPQEAATKPLEDEQRAGLVITALCLFVAAGLVVVGVLAFVVLFWPWVSSCYLEVACR